MKISLSPRLQACCDLVRIGDRVADVGCDHGYLSIYLLQNNIASRVIASDINQGPLASAIANGTKYDVTDRISFHLSAGVTDIPQDFDTMVCAGMGADTIISILDDAPWLNSGQYRLILQCQSKSALLRQHLWNNGWDIRRETAIKDGRFIYTVMEVCRGDFIPENAGQFYFSPALATNTTSEAKAYLKQAIRRLEHSVSGKGEKADPTQQEALRKLINLEATLW